MKASTSLILRTGLTCASAVLAANAHAVAIGPFENTVVTYGGHVKLDTMITDFSDGDLASGAIGRDIYVPGATPITAGLESAVDEGARFDMHAKQSRFNIGTTTTVDGVALKTFFELDFLGSAVGDERVTNSYNPRLRHAYLSYGNWTFGQTWSTFQNTNSLPDTVDIIGNTDAGIFILQPQIRWTLGNWQVSIENPETTVGRIATTASNNGNFATVNAPAPQGDSSIPDLVGRYNLVAGGFTASFAALLRQLTLETPAATPAQKEDASETAFGLNISGKWMIGQDDLRFGVAGGQGLGRYIGLNFVNCAIYDPQTKELDAVNSIGYFAAYRHLWSPSLRSNIEFSELDVANDDLPTTLGILDQNDRRLQKVASGRINLIYNVTPKLSFGWELTHAEKAWENSQSGSMDRIQFGSRLDF